MIDKPSPIYRVSASRIASFYDFWMKNETDDELFDYHSLLADWSGLRPPGEAAMVGTAIHELLQNPSLGVKVDSEDSTSIYYRYHRDDQDVVYAFPMEPIEVMQNHAGAYFDEDTSYEVKTEKMLSFINPNYRVPEIQLVCQADAIRGLIGYEIKTTSSYEYEKYASSPQWRLYLYAFGLESMVYLIYPINRTFKDIQKVTVGEYDDTLLSLGYSVGKEVTIQPVGLSLSNKAMPCAKIEFHRYDHMEKHILEQVERFWQFVVKHNLENLFSGYRESLF